MPSQLFKNTVPIEVVYTFLSNICITCSVTGNHYMVNTEAYKRAHLNNLIIPFMENIKPFYHTSKQNYVSRKMSYSNFITVLRQLCNLHSISYTSKISYDKSSYEIVYFINKNSQFKTESL